MSWYKVGDEGKKAAAVADAQTEAEMNKAYWFRLGSNEEALVLLVDNPMFFFKDHHIRTPAGRYNHFTCIQDHGVGPCPGCAADPKYPAFCVAGTIIRLTPLVSQKTGKTYKFLKQPVVFRGKKVRELLQNRQKDHGDLKFSIFRFRRGSKQTESSIGEDITFVKKIQPKSMAKYFTDEVKKQSKCATLAEWLKPLDYIEQFQPPTPEMYANKLGVSAGDAGGYGGGSFGSDFDSGVPGAEDSTDLDALFAGSGSDAKEETKLDSPPPSPGGADLDDLFGDSQDAPPADDDDDIPY